MSAKNNLKIKIFKFLNLEYIISEIKDVDWFIVIPDHQSGGNFTRMLICCLSTQIVSCAY